MRDESFSAVAAFAASALDHYHALAAMEKLRLQIQLRLRARAPEEPQK